MHTYRIPLTIFTLATALMITSTATEAGRYTDNRHTAQKQTQATTLQQTGDYSLHKSYTGGRGPDQIRQQQMPSETAEFAVMEVGESSAKDNQHTMRYFGGRGPDNRH